MQLSERIELNIVNELKKSVTPNQFFAWTTNINSCFSTIIHIVSESNTYDEYNKSLLKKKKKKQTENFIQFLSMHVIIGNLH